MQLELAREDVLQQYTILLFVRKDTDSVQNMETPQAERDTITTVETWLAVEYATTHNADLAGLSVCHWRNRPRQQMVHWRSAYLVVAASLCEMFEDGTVQEKVGKYRITLGS